MIIELMGVRLLSLFSSDSLGGCTIGGETGGVTGITTGYSGGCTIDTVYLMTGIVNPYSI